MHREVDKYNRKKASFCPEKKDEPTPSMGGHHNPAENQNKKFFTFSNFIYIIIVIIISIYIQKIIIQRKNKEISKLEMKVLN